MFWIILIAAVIGCVIGYIHSKSDYGTSNRSNYYKGSNYMFWTRWVRGVSKIMLAIKIIGSLVVGGILIATEDELFIALGIGVMIVGIILSIDSVSKQMMISEISINTYKLNNKEQVSNNSDYAESKPVSNSSIPSTSGSLFGADRGSQKRNPHDSWVCRCGCRNQNSANYCRSCGNKKP